MAHTPSTSWLDPTHFDQLRHTRELPRDQQPLPGTTARVTLYESSDYFSEMAPTGVAKKTYFDYRDTPAVHERLGRLFLSEIKALEKLNGRNGTLKLIGYHEQRREILMTRVTGETAGQKIRREPAEAETVMQSFIRSLVRLHGLSRDVFEIPACVGNTPQKTLHLWSSEPSNPCPWQEIFQHYREEILKLPNPDFVLGQFRIYIQILKPAEVWLAYCNGDPSFSSYFPDSQTFIDFNASCLSPIQRDLAAAMIDFFYSMYENDRQLSRQITVTILKSMVSFYITQFQTIYPEFGMDYNMLRFFIGLYLIKKSHFLPSGKKEQWISKAIKMMEAQEVSGPEPLIQILLNDTPAYPSITDPGYAYQMYMNDGTY